MEEFCAFSNDDLEEKVNWCIENFGSMQESEKWKVVKMILKDVVLWHEFKFYDDDYAAAFKLRWMK